MRLMRDPSIVVRGDVSSAMVAYAIEKAEAVAAIAPGPVLDLDLRLEHRPDPARQRPHHVQVTINLDGRVLRAHRHAETMTEAIDRAMSRLRRRVESQAERPQSAQLRHRDESWHHDDARAIRPGYFPRPVEERRIVRRKTFAMRPESIEEALFDLEALDHDFFVFVNDETGEENVVYFEDGDYAIMQPTPTPDAIAAVGVPVRSGPPPATMNARAACEVLDETDQGFVFCVDDVTHRGFVVYRRYDGNYGLITAE
jgi:ribosome-associated translation inhibitor RaiA